MYTKKDITGLGISGDLRGQRRNVRLSSPPSAALSIWNCVVEECMNGLQQK